MLLIGSLEQILVNSALLLVNFERILANFMLFLVSFERILVNCTLLLVSLGVTREFRAFTHEFGANTCEFDETV
ncbi:hypothetical protein [Peribacillus simplex]|uniref:hypothetical protein n=1 Tax=Peribacillus simplex TaxID=1478 RepID=UPI00119CC56C|nr:hypothetical protein [Peribacillus simplex]